MYLPPEIWETILDKIDDPLVLTKMKIVSKTWCSIIQRLLHKSKKWKDVCLSSKIDADTLVQLKAKAFPTVGREQDSNDQRWCMITMSYFKWRQFLNLKLVPANNIQAVPNFPKISVYERIKTIDVWDDFLAVGTDEGLIYFSKVSNPREIFFQADHRHRLHLVKFWYNGERLMAASLCFLSNLKFWDIFKMQEIETNVHHATDISIKDKYCISYCSINGTIRICVLESGRIRSKEVIDLINPELEPPGPISLFTFRGQQLFIVFNLIDKGIINRFKLWRFHEASNCPESGVDYTLDYESEYIYIPNLPRKMPRKIQFLFGRDSTFFIIDGQCLITLAAELEVEKLPGLRMTCAIIHADMLIAGTDSGVLVIYDINQKKRFLKKQWFIDNKSIVALVVTEIKEKPFIICATTRNVYILNLS